MDKNKDRNVGSSLQNFEQNLILLHSLRGECDRVLFVENTILHR